MKPDMTCHRYKQPEYGNRCGYNSCAVCYPEFVRFHQERRAQQIAVQRAALEGVLSKADKKADPGINYRNHTLEEAIRYHESHNPDPDSSEGQLLYWLRELKELIAFYHDCTNARRHLTRPR